MNDPRSETLTCPVADACGGCALIGRAYDEQLRIKTGRVRDALAAWAELPEEIVEPCLAAPLRAAYRNRAKLAVEGGSRGVLLGLHRRGTNEVVDLAPCRVQRPALQEGLRRLRDWLGRHRLARPRGPVIQVDLRETSDGGCHATLVLDGERVKPESLPVDALMNDWSALTGVAVNIGDARSSYAMGPVTHALRGPESFRMALPVADGSPLALDVPPGGFFQVAPSALPAVHERMREHLGEEGTLFDLYCGVGVHGLVLASRAPDDTRLIGIESSRPLVAAARRNAARLAVDARFESGTVEDRFEVAVSGEPPARIVLNPGRAGCRAGVIERLAASGAARMAYLSCNPETLARDLARLSRRGVRPTRVIPVDLMPQTDQVEVLALLSAGR